MVEYMVNPSDEEDAVLFNAEEDDFLDYEENPRRRRRRPRTRRRRGIRRRTRRIGRPRRRRKYYPRRRRARRAPRRRRRRRRHEDMEENAWYDERARHSRAAKLGWRRRRRRGRPLRARRRRRYRRYGEYEDNPRRRRRRRYPLRRYRRRRWESNPSSILSLPTWRELKAKPLHSVGFGLLGWFSTGLIGTGIGVGLRNVAIPEPAKDATRIVGEFIGGTAVAYGVATLTKNTTWGRICQLGTYICTALDAVGTVVKYVMRLTASPQYKVKGVMTPMPLDTSGTVARLFGFGGFLDAMKEKQLVEAIKSDGVVEAVNQNGEVALANASTGEIIVSGPADAMKPIVSAARSIAFKTEGEDSGLGEDITVES